jgi:hypothetical protein
VPKIYELPLSLLPAVPRTVEPAIVRRFAAYRVLEDGRIRSHRAVRCVLLQAAMQHCSMSSQTVNACVLKEQYDELNKYYTVVAVTLPAQASLQRLVEVHCIVPY